MSAHQTLQSTPPTLQSTAHTSPPHPPSDHHSRSCGRSPGGQVFESVWSVPQEITNEDSDFDEFAEFAEYPNQFSYCTVHFFET